MLLSRKLNNIYVIYAQPGANNLSELGSSGEVCLSRHMEIFVTEIFCGFSQSYQVKDGIVSYIKDRIAIPVVLNQRTFESILHMLNLVLALIMKLDKLFDSARISLLQNMF